MKKILIPSVLASFCWLVLPITKSQAADGTWISLNSGNWIDPANWAGGIVAEGEGATATFNVAIAGTRNITLDQTNGHTIGHLVLQAGNQWNINAGKLTFATAGPVIPSLTFGGSGTHFMAATIYGTQGLNISGGGGGLVVRQANQYSGITTINSGTVTLRDSKSLGASGPGNGTVLMGDNATAQLHLSSNNNFLVLDEDITIKRTVAGGSTVLWNDDSTTAGVNTISTAVTLERGGTSSGNFTYGVQVNGKIALKLAGGITGKLTEGATQGAAGTDANVFRIKTATATAVANITGAISDGTIGGGGISVYTTTDSLGVVNLSAANTYSGSTIHNKGILLVNNTTGSGTGEGVVSIKQGAIFGGTGSIAPQDANGVLFENGAILAPGGKLNEAGLAVVSTAGEKLTFNLRDTTGKVTFASGAIINLDANALTSLADGISFTGLTSGVEGVIFNNNVINLSVTGGILADGLYTLVSFDKNNAYTGNLVLGSGFSGLDARLVHNANGIVLQIGESPIPEPATIGMILGVSMLAFVVIRRRR